jgi:single-strand DNA-binding protein
MNSTITIIGNLTRDPELRFTGSGQSTATLTVAVNRRIAGKADAPPTETVSYFTVVVWGQLAENACESLTKGHRIVATGRLDQRVWTTAEGEKRTTYEITADDIGASLRFGSATISRVRRAVPSAEDVRSVVLGPDADRTRADDELVHAGHGEHALDDAPF